MHTTGKKRPTSLPASKAMRSTRREEKLRGLAFTTGAVSHASLSDSRDDYAASCESAQFAIRVASERYLGMERGIERRRDKVSSDGSVANVDPRYVLVCKATDELSMSATRSDETLQYS
jgi:hypothetical protein